VVLIQIKVRMGERAHYFCDQQRRAGNAHPGYHTRIGSRDVVPGIRDLAGSGHGDGWGRAAQHCGQGSKPDSARGMQRMGISLSAWLLLERVQMSPVLDQMFA
jgi:hypothetical protein